MPSFTYGPRLACPKIRWVLVSFSVKSRGTSPSHQRYRVPRSECEAVMTVIPFGSVACSRLGLWAPSDHGPGIAEPQGRQDVEQRGFGPTIGR